MPMSVNMFGLALTNDAHMRAKNGQPHQRTTGVASTKPIQFTHAVPIRCPSAPPVAMSPIVSRNTGRPNATPIQKRRVMSTSSGFGASAMSATRGSRAMPHFGQAPGLSLTTSGCIGQVYSIVATGTAESPGSSAIPHFGHAPGVALWTSGSIGQIHKDEVLGAGCWVLGARCWVLGARCWVLGARCWVLGVKCWVLGAKC